MANATKTVKSSGGDYTSLNAALAGLSGNLTTDCAGTGGAGILTIECYAMQDTTAVDTGTGYTTSADYYINITVPTAERHAGIWNDSKYRLVPSGEVTSFKLGAAYTKIIGLQVSCTTGNYDYRYAIASLATGVNSRISQCILKNQNPSNAYRRGISIVTAGPYYIYNNIVYGFSGTGCTGIYVDTASDKVYIYNNTVVNCAIGIDSNGYQDIVSINNITNDCTDGFSGTFDANSDYNCSDIESDAPGANSVTGEVIFADEANDDFHLGATDSVAINAGSGATPKSIFTDDIDGQSRPGTDLDWDIGADEYVAAAALPKFMYHYMHH